jgi:hypothetical protein
MLSMNNQFLLVIILIVGFTSACKKKNGDPQPQQQLPPFRTNTIDYKTLTPTTSYRETFFDKNGDSTVDRSEGRIRLRMFKGLFDYISTATSGGAVIDSTTISNLFANENSVFTGMYADLNGNTFSIKSATAASVTNKSQVDDFLEHAFGRMAYISQFSAQTAAKGTAGKSGTYLLDENGVEWSQIIQKALIGGYHLDYIANVMLAAGLDADNQKLVPGKNYTQLEHNWDVAYGFLSFNDIYAVNATAVGVTPASSGESYLGSYVWEYNKDGYVKLHSAFLKGRAAVHNNDMAEVLNQAAIIRGILETAIGGAANGYMVKASNPSTVQSSRAHAFAEGYGFLYATRFCKRTGCSDAFSKSLMDDIFTATVNNFYDVTAAQFTQVSNVLKQKFNLQ